MRRSFVPCVVWLAVLAAGSAAMQAQVVDESAGPTTKAADLLRYVHFRVTAGRVSASCAPQGLSLTTETTEKPSGRWERLTLTLTDSSPGLHYEHRTQRDNVAIELTEGQQLSIRRQPRGEGVEPLQFEQRPLAEVTLAIGRGDAQRVVRAATLWHLFIYEPEICRTQLAPLLEILRPSWHLAARADATEAALLRWAQARQHIDRARLADLVERLGSPRFAERRAAERELTAIGDAALIYLASLRRDEIDAEQWSRVRGLLAALSDTREDTINRCVSLLAGDPQVWLAMLARPDEAQRRAAADELQLLLNKPIDFDPAAPADQRAAQIKQLRAGWQAPARAGQAEPAGP